MSLIGRHRALSSELAGAVVLSLALLGCGSSTTKTSDAAGSSSGRSSTASSAASGGGSSSAAEPAGTKAVDVCGLLPASEVAQITDEPITEAKSEDLKMQKDNGLFSCSYTSADESAEFDISVTTKMGHVAYDSDLDAVKQVPAAKATDVPGLGDKAFAAIDGLHALFGDVEITVSGSDLMFAAAGSTNDALTPAITLVKTVHDRL